MSVLTKIFVILNVVLSLVLTSGLIVFVNRSEDTGKQARESKAAEQRATTGRLLAEQQLAAVTAEQNLRVLEAEARGGAYRAALAAGEQRAKNAEAAIAAATAAQEKSAADAATATAAANSALGTIDAQQKVINDVSQKLATREKETAQLQTRVAALVQDVDGRNARIRRLQEEVAEVNNKLDELTRRGGAQADRNGTGQAGGAEFATGMSLRGVVKAKRNINGIEYATISLGSAQNVQKGMQFKAVDGGNFLGYVIVDSVETDESVGHLTGPSLPRIGPGTQVRTQ